MITIFHFIAFFSAAIGLAIGGFIGDKFYGIVGGFFLGGLGTYIGLIVGRLPSFFSKHALVKKIQCKTTEELRAILHGHQFHLFHLAFATLAVRGEDIQKERGCVLKLLTSDNYTARVYGWQTLQHFFPEMAKQIAEYRPKDSVEVCLTKTQRLAENPVAGLT